MGWDCSQRDILRNLDAFMKPIGEPSEKPQKKCRDISERRFQNACIKDLPQIGEGLNLMSLLDH